MPITYALSDAGRFVTIRVTAPFDPSDARRCYDDIVADPGRAPNAVVLNDVTALTDGPGTADIRGYAQLVARLAAAGMRRFAVVVTGDLLYGLAQQFSSFTDDADATIEVNVFRAEDEARAWLTRP